jgi:hypothetical protein
MLIITCPKYWANHDTKILCPEFLLHFQKQQEDLVMTLASNQETLQKEQHAKPSHDLELGQPQKNSQSNP